MRRYSLIMAIVMTSLITTVACKDSKTENLEESMEQRSDDLEDASDEVGDAAEDMEEAMENFKKALEEIDNNEDREAIRARINELIDNMNLKMEQQ